MDYAACNIVYCNRKVQECRLVKRGDATLQSWKDASTATGMARVKSDDEADEVYENLDVLLGMFSKGKT